MEKAKIIWLIQFYECKLHAEEELILLLKSIVQNKFDPLFCWEMVHYDLYCKPASEHGSQAKDSKRCRTIISWDSEDHTPKWRSGTRPGGTHSQMCPSDNHMVHSHTYCHNNAPRFCDETSKSQIEIRLQSLTTSNKISIKLFYLTHQKSELHKKWKLLFLQCGLYM